ncbi:MAG: hypothetical protein IJ091_10665 [Oscillospiraceae bacterium]|nr:hypothetical protein [Oscillospiraceae bacterium]
MDLRDPQRRKYVTVTAIHYINGLCCPQVLETEAGAFLLEDVKKIQKLSSKNEYGADERYLVKLNGQDRYLYREGDRWFIIPDKKDFEAFGLVQAEW